MASINIIDLPDVVLEKIISFLSFDEMAKNRRVCTKFNTSCKSMLNRGFVMAERRQSMVSRGIKICLPRRESERRAHPLARHCEILSALETRISMLSMTFMKFIEGNLCCFIPGKIIDEILHILKVVQSTPSPPRTHDLLQELRDISSMAMEHFEEHIVPSLRVADVNAKKSFPTPGTSLVTRMGRPLMPEFLRREFKAIHQHSRSHIQQLNGLKKTISRLSVKVKRQSDILAYQTTKFREQRRMIQDQVSNINEMKKQLEDWDLKFADLTNEFIRNREKPSENKSSQTQNEISDSEIVDDLDLNYTPLSPRFQNESRVSEIIRNCGTSSTFQGDTSSFKISEPFSRFGSNIRPRVDLSYKYKPGKSLNYSRTPESLSFLSRNYLEKPKIRRSIADFRACLTKPAEESTEKQEEVNNRKRKVIDLIASVVDSKVPKIEDTRDITKDQKQHTPSVTPTNIFNDIFDVKKCKGKKRGPSYIENTGKYPNKRSATVSN